MTRRMIAILAAGVLVLAGCSTDDEDEEDTSAPASVDVTPDEDDETADDEDESKPDDYEAKEDLALEAAEVMSTWSPAEDLNWTQSELRARDLMTDERADEVQAPQRQAIGERWKQAAEDDATSEPHVWVVEGVDQSGDELMITVKASWSWVSEPEGASGGGPGRTYYFTFTDEEPYLIQDYTYDRDRD